MHTESRSYYFCAMRFNELAILNLPKAPLQLKESGGKRMVFDSLRRKWVALTPEEWVRQHFIHYLCTYRGVPRGLLGVEVAFSMNGVNHRADVIVYGADATPLLVVECKAPEVSLSSNSLGQVVRYNSYFKAPFVAITNGLKHYAVEVCWDSGEYRVLDSVPDYGTMKRKSIK